MTTFAINPYGLKPKPTYESAIGEIVKLGTAVAGAMTGNPGLMAAGAGMGDTTSSINNLTSGLNFDRNLFDGVRLSDYGQFKRGS